MRSADLIVDSRWAITIAVRFSKHHVQPFLDLRLGERIDAGGGLIQDDDGRVLKQHARQGDQLALAHRDPRPSSPTGVASPCGSASSQSPPPTRDATATTSVIGRGRLAVADVVGHGAGKQERRLRHDAKLAAVGMQVEGANILAIDQQLPALELVEARHQLAQARFARAGVPDQRQGLAGLDGQVEVFQHLLIGGIAEIQVAELDRPCRCGAGRLSVWTTRGSASIRAKTRSLAARPSWNWLQKEAMLISGNQNRLMLSMNR